MIKMKRGFIRLKAVCLVLIIHFGLKTFSFGQFNRVLSTVGRFNRPLMVDSVEVGLLIRAVDRAGRRLLGAKPCLTQAIVVHWLLKRRGIPNNICIGVLQGEQFDLKAHAWVVQNQQIIIGNLPDLEKYQLLPQLDLFVF